MFSIFAETSVAMDIFKEDMSPWYVYTSSMENQLSVRRWVGARSSRFEKNGTCRR